jgi:hypothetical protein
MAQDLLAQNHHERKEAGKGARVAGRVPLMRCRFRDMCFDCPAELSETRDVNATPKKRVLLPLIYRPVPVDPQRPFVANNKQRHLEPNPKAASRYVEIVNMADNQDSSDHEDPFASPSKVTREPQEPPRTPANQGAPFDAEEVRDVALRKELEGVRAINETIEGVLGTLERAKGNMDVRLWCCGHPSLR